MPDLKEAVENFIKTGSREEVDSRDWAEMIPFEWGSEMREKDYVSELEDFLFEILADLEKISG